MSSKIFSAATTAGSGSALLLKLLVQRVQIILLRLVHDPGINRINTALGLAARLNTKNKSAPANYGPNKALCCDQHAYSKCLSDLAVICIQSTIMDSSDCHRRSRGKLGLVVSTAVTTQPCRVEDGNFANAANFKGWLL